MAALLSLHTISKLQANLSTSRVTVKPRAALHGAQRMRVPYELKQEQSRLFHQLPSGLNMEVIVQKGVAEKESDEKKERTSENPPLVFVHGSYHAAWCWAEHWMPFFSASGYDCYAVSLLGQFTIFMWQYWCLIILLSTPYLLEAYLMRVGAGKYFMGTGQEKNSPPFFHVGEGESDAPSASVAGTLQTHASDVADFICKKLTFPPVLIGHSFGGLIIQYYIANAKPDQFLDMRDFFPELMGAALVCSVPPSGNSGLVWRYLFSKPIAAFKVTRSLAAKGFQTSLPLCKETFFSATMEDHLVLRYQELMKKSSRMPLFDLRKLNAALPVPSVPKSAIELLVLGANDDFIVDAEGLKETGRFYGVSPICVEAVAHDMMLDCLWDKGAKVILSWLKDLKK